MTMMLTILSWLGDVYPDWDTCISQLGDTFIPIGTLFSQWGYQLPQSRHLLITMVPTILSWLGDMCILNGIHVYPNWEILLSRLGLYSPNEDTNWPQLGHPINNGAYYTILIGRYVYPDWNICISRLGPYSPNEDTMSPQLGHPINNGAYYTILIHVYLKNWGSVTNRKTQYFVIML